MAVFETVMKFRIIFIDSQLIRAGKKLINYNSNNYGVSGIRINDNVT
jgi:hypothetical protein